MKQRLTRETHLPVRVMCVWPLSSPNFSNGGNILYIIFLMSMCSSM
jgi:hypothetical protein